MSSEVTVAVVGGGPVGLTAAVALARAGVDVRVLEASPTGATQSRASTFHAASLEYLAELDLAGPLLEEGLQAPVFQLRERGGDVLAEFDLGELADETDFPFRLQCEQHKYCRIAEAQLRRSPLAQVDLGCAVTDVVAGADGATVRTADGDHVRARYVVAADGAHSAVRRALGTASESYTYPRRFIIVSTTFDVRSVFSDLAHVSYIADPDDWLAVIHSPDHWRLLFEVAGDEPDAAVLSPGAVQARVAGFLGARAEPYPVADVTLYRVHRKVLDRFRQGPVLFAGDAAHLNNPLGGQGMNSGIHDAVTLARSIARALEDGPGGDGVLDAWAQARREVAVSYIQHDTDANYRALTARDPAERAAYRAALHESAADADARRASLRRSSMLSTFRLGNPN